MIKRLLLLVTSSLFLQSIALAQQTAQGESPAAPAARSSIAGMKTYYEPVRVVRNGSSASFSLYRSSTPGAADETGRYTVNCETHDLSSVVGGVTTPPQRLIAGEDVYPIAKILCDWEKKSFFQKLLD